MIKVNLFDNSRSLADLFHFSISLSHFVFYFKHGLNK